MAFEWTDEMVATLNETMAANTEEVPYDLLGELATQLEVSTRSVGAKLRALGANVQKKPKATSAWSDQEADALRAGVEAGKNDLEIADMLKKDVRQVRGKALSMGLASDLIYTKQEVVEKPKTFTDEETVLVISMAEAGKYLEEIADATGKTKNQVRGKLLSLKMSAPQRDKVASSKTKVYTDEVIAVVEAAVAAGDTAEDIATANDLKLTGLKSFLGKRGLRTPDMGSSKNKYSEEDYETIKEMAADGSTPEEVAEAMERTVQSIRVVAGRIKADWAYKTATAE